jgi:general stress protein YciG
MRHFIEICFFAALNNLESWLCFHGLRQAKLPAEVVKACLKDHERTSAAGRKDGKSVPDEKRSFPRDCELAAEVGRKGGHSVGRQFA